jgi:4-amino-4-deoxy-L-arabinose transferase-like glycosyltransferase
MIASADLLRRLAGARPPSFRTAMLLILVCHGAYVLAAGVTLASDSPAYAYWSQRMIDSGFDYPALLAEAKTSFPGIFYLMFVTLLALLRLVFGSGWATALVALNFAAHVILGALIVRLAVRLTRSAAAGWGALLLFLGCFDLLGWVPFILSDATFVLLAFAIFTLAAGRILGDSRGWLPVFGAAAVGILYRPTGMVLLPDLAWAFYLARTRARAIRRGPVLAALGAGIALLVLAFAWLVQDPGRWPFAAFAGSFRTTAADYALGEVVSARWETYHLPPVQLTDFALISLDRFLHFFALDAATFSRPHAIAELVFFLPCYALAAWLAVALWRRGTAFEAPERKVFLAAFGALLSYAVFHGLVQVDYDWRYRLPILPHLILLAGGGLADLVRRAAAR